METNYFTPITPINFVCEYCDFICSKKSDMDRHNSTRKHKRLTTTNEKTPKTDDIFYDCICGKKYKHISSLCKHKKTCTQLNNHDDTDGIKLLHMENKEIIELLKQQMKENGELCKQLKSQNETINELASKVGTHTINNKTFNLNLFLNETCKDALNITDFIKSIKLQLSDLEATGRLGYVGGISKILLHNLNGLDTHQRPIHCSDFKREILYIKDDNQWIKDDDDKLVLQNAIKHIASKHMRQIPEWVKCNPDCYNSDSKSNDKYLKIVSNSMSGSSKEEQDKNIHLIIKNLAKEVVIQK
jgi:hypothetical protein